MALALLVRTQFEPLIDADRAATRSATDVTREHPGLLHLLPTWQRLSSARYLYVLAALVCLWVWRRHHLTTRALWAFVTMMVGWNLARGVKDLVQRARPVVADPVSHAQGFSFPSDVTAGVLLGVGFVGASYVGYVDWRPPVGSA